MKLPRFRVRTLLILVVLAAVGLGGYISWRRSIEYHRLAGVHGDFEAQADEVIAGLQEAGSLPLLPGADASRVTGRAFDGELERCKQIRDASRRKRLMYERAARYPWLTVASDPE